MVAPIRFPNLHHRKRIFKKLTSRDLCASQRGAWRLPVCKRGGLWRDEKIPEEIKRKKRSRPPAIQGVQGRTTPYVWDIVDDT